jgi:hypothetical protein
MTVEQIARVCHEANTALCVVLGDNVLVHWNELDQSYRDSSIVGVKMVLSGATYEQLHDSWMAERIAQGWKYGPMLDRVAKIHPNLVAYSKLPPQQRLKDALFAAVVNVFKDKASER